ncbi:T9SS-dependent M36 family metallopeptidase [Hymenobacter ginsengisoli]|uniref:T9SS-dependent M36 family metallopeptidase n=1 Tax=Hymenobacter ginsengisoli TaxID=1051626 RepID=A0ABP8QED6_9BACT|nr:MULTISPECIES: M36 family metallopeptidase [unclassified Hymenobacter]MBO2031980.1 M36 family metallopeptidase [Hymenobacter sp. BT559]
MALYFTRLGYRTLALAAALALPGLAMAQQASPALTAFAASARAQGLAASDVADVLVTNSYTDASTGLTHIYVQQRVNGLVIFNATGAVHTDKTGKVVFATQDFVANAAAKAAAASPALTPEQAVVAASVGLGLPRPVGLRTLVEARVADGLVFNNGGISEENIPVRLVYTRQDDKLVLTWNVTITQLNRQHAWNARVDAQTGHLLEHNDYVVSEAATFSEAVLRHQNRQPLAAFAPAASPAGVRSVLSPSAAGSLTVYPVPVESPNTGTRQVVPLASANPTYSPYGWQVSQAPAGTFPDSYSLASSGKFLTRGNNVAAYDDNSNTVTGPGDTNYKSATSSPDGGSTLNFDFPFVQTDGARANLNASITNLFYWNNMVHDVMMAHGFNEVSGNYQYKNATGAGAGTDPVRAEAQDGSGRDNANFYITPDGSSGTMQMYLFDNIAGNKLVITGSSAGAGTYRFVSVAYGPSITKKPLAGNLVLVNDGVSADGGDHACATPFANAAAVNGSIALIQRGGCPQLQLNPKTNSNFSDKIRRAQANGAVGVILFDSVASTNYLSIGSTDTAGIRIPSIYITGVDGFKLRSVLQSGGSLTLASATPGADFDGAFDNAVVSHEYGHGVTNRLTGGPSSANCLIQSYTSNGTTLYTQVMGEGWSDFIGLWMTTQPGSLGNTPRYVGSYLLGGTAAAGPGFRTYPYSINTSVNPLTYGRVGSNATYSESHALGEVWAETLWDLNWQFIGRYGYNADMFGTTGGNNQMLKLVLDGCRLQVCNPGFLDGRDALLRADTLTNRAANADLIWNVFARRGMGYGAKQGDRVNGTPRLTNIKEAFDLPPNVRSVTLATQNGATVSSSLEAFPNPAQDRLTVRTQLASTAPMRVVVLDLLGKTVLSATVPTAQMQQTGIELNTGGLATGLYIVRVTTSEGNFTTKVTIQH